MDKTNSTTMALLKYLQAAGYYEIDIRNGSPENGDREVVAYYDKGNHPEINGICALYKILEMMRLDGEHGYGECRRGKKLFDRCQFEDKLNYGTYSLTTTPPERIG